MWHRARAQHRLGEVEAPAAVRGERGDERPEPAVRVEPDLPHRVEAVPLARHRHVLGAGEAQPDRTAGQRGAERGDRGEAVRLHLLAAEAAAHPQALHGDLVARQAQHVGDDLLGLARMLRARLDEDLPVLVDERERRVRLQVEVLLPGELELALEDVGARVPLRLGLAAAHGRPGALEALRRDRLGHRDQRRQRLVLDLDAARPEPGGFEGLAEHPAHRVPAEADLRREERLVVLHARVVHAGHVGGGEHAHHARHAERGLRAQRRHARVRVRRLHRVGVQRAGVPVHQVVRVQRQAGDVQVGALVRHRHPDDGACRDGSQSSVMPAPRSRT